MRRRAVPLNLTGEYKSQDLMSFLSNFAFHPTKKVGFTIPAKPDNSSRMSCALFP